MGFFDRNLPMTWLPNSKLVRIWGNCFFKSGFATGWRVVGTNHIGRLTFNRQTRTISNESTLGGKRVIRLAEKSDVDQVVPLVMIILKDMELGFLKKYGEDTLVEVLKLAFTDESFRFGYARGIVLEEEGDILGVAFGYLDRDEPVIDEPLKAIYQELGIPEDEVMFGDKEAFENEWYLDSIAVRADQRGRGIGAQLLEALPRFATQQGANKIGLSVDDVNPRAKQLYLRQGFKEVGRAVISGHQYDHMQKEI